MKRFPRGRYVLIGGALLLLAAMAGGNYIATWWLGQAMPGVRLTWVQVNPLTGRLHMHGLDYRDSSLHIQAPHLDIETDLAALFAGRLDLVQLRLNQPVISVRLDRPWQTGEMLPVRHINIRDGRLILLRASGAQGAPMRITADIRRADSAWKLSARLSIDSGSLHLTGDMGAGSGRFHVRATGIPLAATGLPALADAQGRASGELDIRTAASMLAMHGWAEATDVSLKLRGQTQRQTARRIRIAGSFDGTHGWQLRSVRLDHPHLHLSLGGRPVHWHAIHYPVWRIDALNVSGGTVDLMSRDPVGDTRLRLAKLKLTARGLSSERLLPVALSARGRLADGEFAARLQHGIVSGQLTGLDLRRLDRLALATTGHRVYSGTASAVLVGIVQQQKIDATARFDIINLHVGPRIPVPGASASIPLRAAATSLTDMDGHTRFPVHIRGPVSHPSVSVSRATDKAISKATVRLVGLPVTALLKTLTDAPRVMHRVISFRSASTQYADNGEQTMRAIAHVLWANPDMKLEIRGCAYPKRDGAAKPARALKRLAARRARRVRRELIRLRVSPDRIRIVYPKLWLPSPRLGGLGPRVEISILPA